MRSLIYLGAVDPSAGGELQLEGDIVRPGDRCKLVRRRSPWNRHRRVERVIIGTHPERADLHLVGKGILPEHVRVYMPEPEERREVDLLVIHANSVRVNESVVAPRDWTALLGGEVLELAGWRFRFENDSHDSG